MADKQSKAQESSNHPQQDMSRRKFLKNSGLVAGGLVGGGLLGGLITNGFDKKDDPQRLGPEGGQAANDVQEAREFFTREQDFNVLMASTEQLLPEDEHGPGAIGLGVPYYIDKQLAGRWGVNARDYRHSPYTIELSENDKTAGLAGEQSILDRGSIFVLGLRKLDDESQKRFGTSFDQAEEDQQIEVLSDFEANKVKLKGLKASQFFALLLQSTLEGAYSDPLYGGNRNMEGWKMKEFPGAQASYMAYIEQDEFQKMDPISLRDYQGH